MYMHTYPKSRSELYKFCPFHWHNCPMLLDSFMLKIKRTGWSDKWVILHRTPDGSIWENDKKDHCGFHKSAKARHCGIGQTHCTEVTEATTYGEIPKGFFPSIWKEAVKKHLQRRGSPWTVPASRLPLLSTQAIGCTPLSTTSNL